MENVYDGNARLKFFKLTKNLVKFFRVLSVNFSLKIISRRWFWKFKKIFGNLNKYVVIGRWKRFFVCFFFFKFLFTKAPKGSSHLFPRIRL